MTRIVEGFMILKEIAPDEQQVCAEHDTVWAGPESMNYDEYTQQDREDLENLGWHFDESITRWTCYL